MKKSHRVLLDEEELETIVKALKSYRETENKPEIEELENDLRMVIAGTL